MRTHGRLWMVVGLFGVAAPAASAAAQSASVSGNLAILDKGGKRGSDVGQAVLWLSGGKGGAARPVRVDIVTEGKQFSPHILVVPVGSTVAFPNHDPFNHNVFSVSEPASFDLGLYGRGETRSTPFAKAGVVRVYCNVHAQMSAFVIVRGEAYVTQPSADGGFVFTGVAPGSYTLNVWHERGGESSTSLEVGGADVKALAVSLDASKFKFRPHLNKYKRPYDDEGRRY